MNIDKSSDGAYDIAIIGYGPTGLALAYWLGKAGHKVVAIERWPELYALPRAGHIDGEVMRLFQRMGIGDTIAADSSVTTHSVILDLDGQQIARIPAESSDQGWCSHYSLYQPNLERVLDANVRATGNVTVMQGWQADAVTRDADGKLRLAIAAGGGDDGVWIPTGERAEITARWLIGADGANSIVQRFLNSVVEDLGYKARALVLFAERLDPSVGANMPDAEVGMMLPRPYVAFKESGKRFARWEFDVADGEDAAELSTAEKAWEFIAPWGFTPENSRLVRHTVYEFRTLVVENWRQGNVFLAGDSAHRMPPFQGQGMCSGQRDALGLSWRLDLVIRGIADEAILDSYTAERKPHVLELTRNSTERGKEFWLTDPVAARERDARMKKGFASENLRKNFGDVPTLADGFLMKGDGGVVAPAGRLSAQLRVRHEGVEALLDDHTGAQWMLLSTDKFLIEELGAEERELLGQLDVRTVLLGPGEFEDIDGGYAGWFDEIGCRAVLIRPDCYIFGGASDAIGMKAMFASLAQQLHLKVAVA